MCIYIYIYIYIIFKIIKPCDIYIYVSHVNLYIYTFQKTDIYIYMNVYTYSVWIGNNLYIVYM